MNLNLDKSTLICGFSQMISALTNEWIWYDVKWSYFSQFGHFCRNIGNIHLFCNSMWPSSKQLLHALPSGSVWNYWVACALYGQSIQNCISMLEEIKLQWYNHLLAWYWWFFLLNITFLQWLYLLTLKYTICHS